MSTTDFASLIEIDSTPSRNVDSCVSESDSELRPIELDDVPSAAKAQSAKPAKAPKAKPAKQSTAQPQPAPADDGGWNRGVSEASAALVEKERELVKTFGFKHDDKELLFAAGTQLADVGLATAQQYAADYKALPFTPEAAERHTATIAAEQRKDRVIKPCEWRLDINGHIRQLTNGALDAKVSAALSESAWTQLSQRQTEIPAANAARDAIRGNMNTWLGQVPDKIEVKARVRTHGAGRQIYGIVSSGKRGYTAYDGDAVLRDIAKVLPDMRCEVKYDAETTRLRARAIIQAPIDIPAFSGVGRIHQAGIQFTTRDDGMGSLAGSGFISRVRCKNHTLVEERSSSIRRRHVGNFETLRAQISTLFGKLPEMIAELQNLWSRAAAEYYLDSETNEKLSAPEAIARLVHAGHVPTGGLSVEEAVDAYVSAWRAEESPHSAQGVLMAVQRAAHESSWKTKWAEDEVEQAASGLLYQNVYVLDAPESEVLAEA